MSEPQRRYVRFARTGGATGALDAIDGASLNDQDVAWVIEDNAVYSYWLDDDSAATENDPYVISPDSNAGDKRWILAQCTGQNQVNLLSNTGWQVWSNSGLTQGSGSGRQTDFNYGAAILADADGSSHASWAGTDCTITDAGANLLITQTGAATQYAKYTCAGLTPNALYKFSAVIADGTGAWAAGDKLRVEQNGGTLIQDLASEAAGTYSIIWKAVGATDKVTFTVTLGAGETLNITSVYVDQVTPGCVATDVLGPDGWEKTATLDIWREPNGTYSSAGEYYALKATKGADSAEYLYSPKAAISALPEWYHRWRGKTVTIVMKGYSVTVTDNLKLAIYDGSWHVADSYIGADAYEHQELTYTISASATDVRFGFLFDGDMNDVAYISCPMLVYGSSIGEGNYVPPQDKRIYLDQDIALTSYQNATVAANAAIVLESETNGKIGKGMKAVNARLEGSCATAEKNMNLTDNTTATVRGVRIYSQVANILNVNSDWVKLGSDGNMAVTRGDTFNEVYVTVNAVEVR